MYSSSTGHLCMHEYPIPDTYLKQETHILTHAGVVHLVYIYIAKGVLYANVSLTAAVSFLSA